MYVKCSLMFGGWELGEIEGRRHMIGFTLFRLSHYNANPPPWRSRLCPAVRAIMCAPSILPPSGSGVMAVSASAAIPLAPIKPGGARPKSAGAIVRAANANGKDVTAAAAQLHTPLTDHVTVAEHATEAVDRIDCTLNAARLRGDLAFLNNAYPKSDLRFQDHALGTFGHSSNCMDRSDAQYREYFSCARYALFALA